jgi:putative FmdB family regulatory protein
MPLFEYRCDECGRRFTMLVGVTAEKAKLRCPKCGSLKATKLISRIARTSKGEDDEFDDSDFPESGEDLDEGGAEDENDDYGDLDDE